MQVTKKTGALKIEGDRRGRILFRDGTVVGADLTGSRLTYLAEDRQSIADVLYVLASLDSGSFSVSSVDISSESHGWSVEEMLADVEGLGKLEAAVDEAGLIGAAGIRVTDTIDGMIQLDPDDWRIIAKLVQPFNFDHLESRFGRGGAVRSLYTLLRLDVAETVSGDETQFLDRLAEGIVADSSEPTWLETHGSVLEEEKTPLVTSPAAATEAPAGTPEPGPSAVTETEADPQPEPVPAVELLPDAESEEDTTAQPQSAPAVEPSPLSETAEPELVAANSAEPEPVAASPEPEPEAEAEATEEPEPERERVSARGVSADASTTLTDGVYDEIRRLRSKAAEK